MSEAICRNCGSLPDTEFYINLNGPGNPMGVCKKCHRARAAAAQYARREKYKLLGLKITRVEASRPTWAQIVRNGGRNENTQNL